MTAKRPYFSKKERARLFALRNGVCYLCKTRIDGTREAFEVEHEIPWEISRDNSDDNLQLAHVRCHKVKTAKDVADIAKVKRIHDKFHGFHPKSRARIPSRGFASTRYSMDRAYTGDREDHDDQD